MGLYAVLKRKGKIRFHEVNAPFHKYLPIDAQIILSDWGFVGRDTDWQRGVKLYKSPSKGEFYLYEWTYHWASDTGGTLRIISREKAEEVAIEWLQHDPDALEKILEEINS